MSEFKVGDRVRHKTAQDAFAGGVVAEVFEVFGKRLSARLPSGIVGTGNFENWELVERPSEENNELAELRAWKDAAIAKHPDLAPVDPDFDQAKKITIDTDWFSGTDCSSIDDEDWEGSIAEAVYLGIKWARANPR